MALKQRATSTTQLRVALLTNSLSPHTLPLWEAVSAHLGQLIAFVSAATDTFHQFPAPQASFKIIVQRSWNALRLRYSHTEFSVNEHLHLPVDTLPQLLQVRPDVIISSQFGARSLFAIMYCLLRPRVRLILWAALSEHTEGKRGHLRVWLRRLMLRFFDAALVNGQSGEVYLRSLGFKKPICFAPYTIDHRHFLRDGYTPAAERRLLFCGRLEPSKGIVDFLQTLRLWCLANPDSSVHLLVIGDGPDRDAIRTLASVANFHLRLLPRMDRAELPPFFHASDIFVFPTRFDEWGVVVNEALCAGLPVLGSVYSQAITELVQDGENGWTFDSEDPDNRYRQLDRALRTEPAALRTMSARAVESVQAISPEIIAGRVLETISNLCNLADARGHQARGGGLHPTSTAGSHP